MSPPCVFCKQPADRVIRVKKKGEEIFSPARFVCTTCFSRISADPRYDVEEVRQPVQHPPQTKRKKTVAISIPVFCLILAAVIVLSSASTAFVMKRISPQPPENTNEPAEEPEATKSTESNEPNKSNNSVSYDPRYDECVNTIKSLFIGGTDLQLSECIFNPDEMILSLRMDYFASGIGTNPEDFDSDYAEIVKDSMINVCGEFIKIFTSEGISPPTIKTDTFYNGVLLFKAENTTITYDYVAERDEQIALSRPEPRDNCHFRTARWGDDLETVKLYETEPTHEKDGNLFIESVTVAGEKARVGMFFDPDFGFYMGTYQCYEESRVKDEYLARYNRLKQSLTEKYGEPAQDQVVRLKENSLFTEAEALYYGYTQYFAVWYTDDTEIILGAMADGNKYFVDVGINYSCTGFTPAANTGGL